MQQTIEIDHNFKQFQVFICCIADPAHNGKRNNDCREEIPFCDGHDERILNKGNEIF